MNPVYTIRRLPTILLLHLNPNPSQVIYFAKQCQLYVNFSSLDNHTLVCGNIYIYELTAMLLTTH